MTLVVDTGSWTTKVGLASSEASVNVPTNYANEDHPPSATDPTSKLYIDFFNSISNQEDQGGGAQKDSAGEQKENTSWMQNTQSIFLTESRDFSNSKSYKASVIDEIFKLFPLVQQISFGASPYCSLISTGRAEHGLVIDSGYFQTTVTSIFCGNIVRGGEQTDNSSGGWHVTKALSDFTGLSRKECESSIIFHPSPPMLYSPQMQPPNDFVLPDGTVLDQGGGAIHATMMSMVDGMCTASSKAIDSCGKKTTFFISFSPKPLKTFLFLTFFSTPLTSHNRSFC